MTPTRRRFLQTSVGAGVSLASVSSAGAKAAQSGDLGPSREDSADILESMDGTGTEDDPYQITDAEELQAMEADTEGHYELVDDINASYTRNWNDGKGFRPIGELGRENWNGYTMTEPVRLSLDGNSHEIFGLTIQRLERNDSGLFGSFHGEIKDVTLRNVDIQGDTSSQESGSYFVGGVAGSLFSDSSVKNCTVTGDIRGAVSVGSVTGTANDNATVKNCTSDVEIRGYRAVGSLVGIGQDGVRILNCRSAGEVRGYEADGYSYIGGVIGFQKGTLKDTISTVTVDARETDNAGGLASFAKGEITRCVVNSRIKGGLFAGGLAGYVSPPGEIKDSYAMVDITLDWGEGKCGGLLNICRGSVENSFALGTIHQDSTQQDIGKLVSRLGEHPDVDSGDEVVVENCYSGVTVDMSEVEVTTTSPGVVDDINRENNSITVRKGTQEIPRREFSTELQVESDDLGGESARDALVGFDFEETWEPGDEHPLLQWQTSKFEIAEVDFSATVSGSPVEAEVTVTNTGLEEGTLSMEMSAGELGTTSEEITVSSEETVTTRLNLPTESDDSGIYQVQAQFGDETRSGEVSVEQPATFSLTVTSVTQPTEGDEVDVSVTIQNTGDFNEGKTVTAAVGDLGSESVELWLSPGEIANETLSLSTEAGDAGEYDLLVESERDSVSRQVTVEEDESATPTPEGSDDRSEEPTDTVTPTATPTATPTPASGESGTSVGSSGPGFGIGSAIGGAGGVLYVLKRRLDDEKSEQY